MVKCILRNLAVLYIVTLPMFFVWEGVSGLLKHGHWPEDWGAGSMMYFALNIGSFVLAFGAVQQFVLLGIRSEWNLSLKRVAAMMSVLVFMPLFLWMGPALPPGLLLGVLISTLIMRMPRDAMPRPQLMTGLPPSE